MSPVALTQCAVFVLAVIVGLLAALAHRLGEHHEELRAEVRELRLRIEASERREMFDRGATHGGPWEGQS